MLDIFRLHHYSSEGEDKRMYAFCIPIWWPSWISHFTQTIYYITLQIYIGYHLICISASSVPMNYCYMLQLFFGNFLKYVCGFFQNAWNYSMNIHFGLLFRETNNQGC